MESVFLSAFRLLTGVIICSCYETYRYFLFVCFNLISFFVIFLRSELYVLCINLTLLSRVPNSSDRMVLISVPLPGVGHEIKRYKVLFGSF